MTAGSALEQAIEEQLACLRPEEIAGAYRGLCGMMLVHTAWAARKHRVSRNEDAEGKNLAKAWLACRGGIISFPDCCEAFDLSVRRAKAAICDLASRRIACP